VHDVVELGGASMVSVLARMYIRYVPRSAILDLDRQVE
jgi:hypothetical protein